MDPEDIHIAEMRIGLYDGLPRFVENVFEHWLESVARYGLWSVAIKAIEDFR